MRERVVNLFQNLPPEGLALHGTNLARARSIATEGFQIERVKPLKGHGYIWYVKQPPNFNLDYTDLMFEEIKFRLFEVYKFAQLRSNDPNYAFGDGVESKVPAVVAFHPTNKFDKSFISFNSTPFPTSEKAIPPIPKEHILGVFSIEKDRRPLTQMLEGVLTILEHQSPDQG